VVARAGRCRWHQATYDLRGHRTGGPARPGSRLMILPTRVEDGVLRYVYGNDDA
jgi:nitrite reductase/ring-hydroxylating ferredoxin subunit